MSRTKFLSAFAAFGLVSAGVIAAPAAHAANIPMTLTCSGSGSFIFNPSSISPASNDVIQLTNSTGATITVGTMNAIPGTGVVTGTIANTVTGEFQVMGTGELDIGAGSGCIRTVLTWTIGGGGGSGGGGGGSSSSSNSTGPAPTTQQFGLPASGTCEDVAPADLNWAGVPSGGWGISWAQWVNDGAGGPVCSRTLSYIGSDWTVN